MEINKFDGTISLLNANIAPKMTINDAIATLSVAERQATGDEDHLSMLFLDTKENNLRLGIYFMFYDNYLKYVRFRFSRHFGPPMSPSEWNIEKVYDIKILHDKLLMQWLGPPTYYTAPIYEGPISAKSIQSIICRYELKWGTIESIYNDREYNPEVFIQYL